MDIATGQLMTLDEYIAVDSQLPTCELMSDGEIAQLLDKLFINYGEIVAMMSNAGAGSEGAEEAGSQPDAVAETT